MQPSPAVYEPAEGSHTLTADARIVIVYDKRKGPTVTVGPLSLVAGVSAYSGSRR